MSKLSSLQVCMNLTLTIFTFLFLPARIEISIPFALNTSGTTAKGNGSVLMETRIGSSTKMVL